MDTLVEAVRLHRRGDSQRRIAKLLGTGRQTVAAYLDIFKRADLLTGAASSVEPWRNDILRLLDRGGAGPTAIHHHLELHVDGYSGSLPAIKRLCASIAPRRSTTSGGWRSR